MKFLHYARIFLAPTLQAKLYTATVAFEFFLWALLPTISVFFVGSMTRILQSGDVDAFYGIVFQYIGFFFGVNILIILMYRFGWVRFFETIQSILYRQYITTFVHLDPQCIEALGTGKLLYMIQNGVKAHASALTELCSYGVKFILVSGVAFYFIAQVSWIYVGLSVLVFGLLGVYMYIADQQQAAIRRSKYENKKNVSSTVTRVIMSKNEMLSESLREKQIVHIENENREMIAKNVRQNVWMTLLFRGTETSIFILHLVLVTIAAREYFSGELSLSAVVSLSVAFAYFEKTLVECISFYKNFTKELAEIVGLWDFFRTTPKMKNLISWDLFEPKGGSIDFQWVDFSYHSWDNLVLEDLSLSITPRKTTAFVGPSGGGKSTITKLILGYLHPNKGSILVDHQDISKVSLQSFYKSIGYLPQEPNIFDGTIRDNLLASSQDATDHSLGEALRLAWCDFISDMHDGLDTEIGERWIRLSGGQKQRLAIAKIFLKNPEIIILDEPTSALDSFSEEKISYALRTLFHNKTVIIIAHRLQTVKHADEIFVIEGSRVVESGNHTTLVSQNGYYAKMLELQSGF